MTSNERKARIQEIIETADLQSRVVAVTVRLHSIGNERVDSIAKAAIVQTTGVTGKRVKGTKYLIDPKFWEPMAKLKDAFTKWKYANSTPYEGAASGMYLVAASGFEKWWKELTEWKRRIERQAQWMDEHAAEILDEARVTLGPMFNEKLYPASYADSFSIECFPTPIPSTSITTKVSEAQKQVMAERIEAMNQAAVAAAMADVRDKIVKPVAHLAKALETGAKWEYTSLENLRAVADSISSINLLDLPELRDIEAGLRKITAHSTDQIKNSELLQAEKIRDAKAILDRANELF